MNHDYETLGFLSLQPKPQPEKAKDFNIAEPIREMVKDTRPAIIESQSLQTAEHALAPRRSVTERAVSTANSYEEQSFVGMRSQLALSEQYTGTSIVAWHGKIERQLVGLLADAEKSRNFVYSDKIREFLKTWRDHELTGSINVETIEALEAASRMLAVDTWNLASYFSSLGTQLKVLKASEEQLPRGADMDQNEPFAGGGGGGGGAPPMAPAFGPEEEAPGEEGGAGLPGMGGGGGGGGGAGGPGGAVPPAPGEGEVGPDGQPLPPGAEGEEGTPPPANAELPAEAGALGGEAERIEPEEGPPEETIRRI